MTFRELLNLYRSGELSPEQTREVEEAIDREDSKELESFVRTLISYSKKLGIIIYPP